MLKVMRVLASAILALVFLSVLPGCGADTELARERLRSGDALVEQLQEEAQDWNSQISESTQAARDESEFKNAIGEAVSSADRFYETIDRATDEFEAIRSLSGVPEYAKYAALQITALEKFRRLIEDTVLFFSKMAALVDSSDTSSLSEAQNRYFEQVNSLTEEIQKLDEEAQELKVEKDL